MADFDLTIALEARGYNPQDAVARLQADMLAQQGQKHTDVNQIDRVKGEAE